MKTTPDTRPLVERITKGIFRAEGGKVLYGPVIPDPRPMGGTITGCVAIVQGSALRNHADNTAFIVEAFNVAHETGKTPRQLADERAELIAALRKSHEGMDRLFVTLICMDHEFRPSKSGQPWEAITEAHELLTRLAP